VDPVTWVGRWRFTKGRKTVWSCEAHASELSDAKRLPFTQPSIQPSFGPLLPQDLDNFRQFWLGA
jgi:hypothetical protein